MTLLEKAEEIMKLRLEVANAQSYLAMCSIDFLKWRNCYKRYLEMIKSQNSEVVEIGHSLGNSLYNARVLCTDTEENDLNNYKKSIESDLDNAKKILKSNR